MHIHYYANKTHTDDLNRVHRQMYTFACRKGIININIFKTKLKKKKNSTLNIHYQPCIINFYGFAAGWRTFLQTHRCAAASGAALEWRVKKCKCLFHCKKHSNHISIIQSVSVGFSFPPFDRLLHVKWTLSGSF